MGANRLDGQLARRTGGLGGVWQPVGSVITL